MEQLIEEDKSKMLKLENDTVLTNERLTTLKQILNNL